MTAAKIRDGAVGTTKIGDGAVTGTKLTPGERGEGFVSNRPDPLSLPSSTVATVATLNLPPGSFIVTAATALGGAGIGDNNILAATCATTALSLRRGPALLTPPLIWKP